MPRLKGSSKLLRSRVLCFIASLSALTGSALADDPLHARIDKLIAEAETEPAVIPSGSEGEDEWAQASTDVAKALGFVKKESE